jgi:energy-coupling factor transporter transmembrane protein EcfT
MSAIYFVRVVERSERSYSAMISRGFSGQCPSSVRLEWQFKDSLLTTIGFIITIIILTLH